MAAKNVAVHCPKGIWTRVTDSAGTSGIITLVLRQNIEIWLDATTSATVPPAEVDIDDMLTWRPALLADGNGWNNIDLPTLFPGVAGTHLWVYSPYSDAYPFISHA